MTLKNRLQRQVSPTEGSNSGAKMEVLIYFFERDTYVWPFEITPFSIEKYY